MNHAGRVHAGPRESADVWIISPRWWNGSHRARSVRCVTSMNSQHQAMPRSHAFFGTARLVTWHWESACPGLHLRPQRRELRSWLTRLKRFEEVDQLLARRGLRVEANLEGPVQEVANLLEVLLLQAT